MRVQWRPPAGDSVHAPACAQRPHFWASRTPTVQCTSCTAVSRELQRSPPSAGGAARGRRGAEEVEREALSGLTCTPQLCGPVVQARVEIRLSTHGPAVHSVGAWRSLPPALAEAFGAATVTTPRSEMRPTEARVRRSCVGPPRGDAQWDGPPDLGPHCSVSIWGRPPSALAEPFRAAVVTCTWSETRPAESCARRGCTPPARAEI